MAAFCDAQASIYGEVESEAGNLGQDLVDIVAKEGGDCCVPKNKGP